MKKIIPLFFLSTAYALTPSEFDAQAKIINQATATQAVSSSKAQEVMIIEPKMRAQDFVAAFHLLATGHMKEKITFFLTDKSQISNILSLDVLPGGTMISFKLNTTQGIKFKIIPLEQIHSIGLETKSH